MWYFMKPHSQLHKKPPQTQTLINSLISATAYHPCLLQSYKGLPQNQPLGNTAPSALAPPAPPPQSSQVEPPPARMTTRG